MQSIQWQCIQENSGNQPDNDAEHDRDTAEMVLWIELEGQEDTTVANIAWRCLDDTIRNSEERGALGRVTEPADDKGTEVGQAAIGYTDPKVKENHQPDSDVTKGFNELFFFERFVFDALNHCCQPSSS